MKKLSDYRSDMLTILGDESGRRYSDPVLDMGLREALAAYRSFFPRKEIFRQQVSAVDGVSVILPGFFEQGSEILTARTESGYWLDFGEYRTADKIYLNCYGGKNLPAAGEMITMEISVPHTIKDLDGADITTIPDGHALTICMGAAGYSMRIRARSITEVFGKRPEDREALAAQADLMINEYLETLGATQPAVYDPMPRGGFPV